LRNRRFVPRVPGLEDRFLMDAGPAPSAGIGPPVEDILVPIPPLLSPVLPPSLIVIPDPGDWGPGGETDWMPGVELVPDPSPGLPMPLPGGVVYA
jgi:hypothetical protein